MGLFEPYRPESHDNPRADVRVRRARALDSVALGRILAAREGGLPGDHADRFGREIERIEAGVSQKLLLVAEQGAAVLAYGRMAYLPTSEIEGARNMPEGWYLTGVVVHADHRRLGIGHRLIRARLNLAAERTERVYYWTNAQNRVSIELHRPFGFREVTRDFAFPGQSFAGGVGILYVCDLSTG